ncbi:hypothetical protein BDZ91DRAFT_737626 [Kalaharituber pfeilii]|nr:hypothetical protein BDZ91DRAFT_737626 [Kalaharituber pfeilii]
MHVKAKNKVNWYPVVAKVLNGVPGMEVRQPHRLTNLRGETLTTQQVGATHLPIHQLANKPISSVKIDLALGYDAEDEFLTTILPDFPHWPSSLCPLVTLENDFLVAVPIEIKTACGVANQSEVQLSVCASAMLDIQEQWSNRRAQENGNGNVDPGHPPVVVTHSVYGHHWTYYIIYRGEEGPQLQGLSPIPEGDSSPPPPPLA